MLPLPNYHNFDFAFLIELSWKIAQFFSGVVAVLTQESFYTLIYKVPFINDILEAIPILDTLISDLPLVNTPFIWFIFGYAVWATITVYVLKGLLNFLL